MEQTTNTPPDAAAPSPPQYVFFRISNAKPENKFIYNKNYFPSDLDIEIYHVFDASNDIVDSMEIGFTNSISGIIPQQSGGANPRPTNLNPNLPIPYRYISFMFHYIYDTILDIVSPLEDKEEPAAAAAAPEESPSQVEQITETLPPEEKRVTESLLTPATILKTEATPAPKLDLKEVIYIFIKLENVETEPDGTVSVKSMNAKMEQLDIYNTIQIAKILCIQMTILTQFKKTVAQINKDKIFYINGRFFYIDPNSLVEGTFTPSILGNFIQSIFPTVLTNYTNTKLAYFTKRCIEENKMFWV